MKNVLVILAIILSFTTYSSAGNPSKYYIDDNAVDQLFSNSTETVFSGLQLNSISGNFNHSEIADDNEAVVAWIICWFVGELGIHRHYLGTKSNMWAIYTFTCCGIFGIVPAIDWWVLLIDGVINKNIGPYRNNDKFFMWAN
ncbi:MAG: TM2 domain-containing protein [Bacteroidales bacterium]|nr:TM2 domain-containing protein [Bacteroidales bacterium]MCF8458320.1 TM2 domain-containing protein [Bacteroidales bacterium]